jgi:hypothetical protein
VAVKWLAQCASSEVGKIVNKESNPILQLSSGRIIENNSKYVKI